MVTKKNKTKKLEPEPRRRPRQQNLPGTDDRTIADLEAVAQELRDVRESRMALTAQEVTLQARGIHLMKKHGKTHYKRDGIEITLQTEKEKLKVKVTMHDDAGDAAPQDDAGA